MVRSPGIRGRNQGSMAEIGRMSRSTGFQIGKVGRCRTVARVVGFVVAAGGRLLLVVVVVMRRRHDQTNTNTTTTNNNPTRLYLSWSMHKVRRVLGCGLFSPRNGTLNKFGRMNGLAGTLWLQREELPRKVPH